MNSGKIIGLVIHALILLSIQAFLLVGFAIPVGGRYVLSIFIYPLIIFILPLRMPRSGVLAVAFLLGLFMDFFYDSPGVHAGAMVFMAMVRALLLPMLEPRGGYRIGTLPTPASYGLRWFLGYSALLLFAFLLAYFALDVFALALLDKVLVNAAISFLGSYILVMLYQTIIRQ